MLGYRPARNARPMWPTSHERAVQYNMQTIVVDTWIDLVFLVAHIAHMRENRNSHGRVTVTAAVRTYTCSAIIVHGTYIRT